jgi:CBS domain-containing protein
MTYADEEGRHTMTTVAELMKPNPATCGPEDTIQGAAEVMRDQDIGDVVVVDSDGLLGIVTDRDLVVRGLASGQDPASTRLGDVCSRDVSTIEAGADVGNAVDLMRSNALRRLPVVDGDQLVGIVSIGDLAISQDPKSALADISAAPPNT